MSFGHLTVRVTVIISAVVCHIAFNTFIVFFLLKTDGFLNHCLMKPDVKFQ